MYMDAAVRANRERHRAGEVGTIIFGGEPPRQPPPTRLTGTYSSSDDNPLYQPHAPHYVRVPPAPAPPAPSTTAAGRPGSSYHSAGVRTSSRSMSKMAAAPTYQVRRTQLDSGAKALLYGEAPASIDEEHSSPLRSVYHSLRDSFSRISRNEINAVDEVEARRLLRQHAVNLSIDGLAEFLARCDFSGFPTLEQFTLCCQRPHRVVTDDEKDEEVDGEEVARANEEGEGGEADEEGEGGEAVAPFAQELCASAEAVDVVQQAERNSPSQQEEHNIRGTSLPSEHVARFMKYLQMSEAEVTSFADAKSAIPLGTKSSATPLGTNLQVGSRHGRTASISKNRSVDEYY